MSSSDLDLPARLRRRAAFILWQARGGSTDKSPRKPPRRRSRWAELAAVKAVPVRRGRHEMEGAKLALVENGGNPAGVCRKLVTPTGIEPVFQP